MHKLINANLQLLESPTGSEKSEVIWCDFTDRSTSGHRYWLVTICSTTLNYDYSTL